MYVYIYISHTGPPTTIKNGRGRRSTPSLTGPGAEFFAPLELVTLDALHRLAAVQHWGLLS